MGWMVLALALIIVPATRQPEVEPFAGRHRVSVALIRLTAMEGRSAIPEHESCVRLTGRAPARRSFTVVIGKKEFINRCLRRLSR